MPCRAQHLRLGIDSICQLCTCDFRPRAKAPDHLMRGDLECITAWRMGRLQEYPLEQVIGADEKEHMDNLVA